MAKKTKQLFPSASIIIPAYNAEKHLQACLDALLQQTIHPEEIIVVDDGSTDSTRTIAESFSLVTLLTQKNQGPAKARNAGAKKASGDIILFIDSDCVPEKNWLEEMLKPFEDAKVVGVQGAYKTKQKSPTARFDQLDIEYRYERMKKKDTIDWIGTYSAAYQRKVFLEVKGFDETFPKASGEDSELSYRLAEEGMILKFAPNAIVYHTHPDNMSHYFKVKFFRAYWRTRMYWKHPSKTFKDSYTPPDIKAAFFLGSFFLLFILGFILQFFLLPPGVSIIEAQFVNILTVFTVCLIFASIIFGPFIIWLFKRDVKIALFGIPIVLLRTAVFIAGAGCGMFDPRVWK